MAVNPIYTFTLSAWRNGSKIAEMEACPVYGAGLAKDFERESGQMFFREKLNGGLVFAGVDYDFIVGQPFDTKFVLEIGANFHAGIYWKGVFFKTDCEFDDDDCKVSVSPQADDAYKAVLDGLDKEFNLIDLKPEIAQVKFDRRPMLQVYVPGQTSIGCYLSGMWWEEPCEAKSGSALTNTYKFKVMLDSTQRVIELSGDIPAASPSLFVGLVPSTANYFFTADGWTFYYEESGLLCRCRLIEGPAFTGIVRFSTGWIGRQNVPFSVTLDEVGGGTGQITADISNISVYGRVVCDVDEVAGTPTEDLPADDMVGNNRNYTKVLPYNGDGVIVVFNVDFSETPTEWGQYEPGKYYQMPRQIGPWYPVARRAWSQRSIWINPRYGYQGLEAQARAASVLKDAFPVSSVISVLLGQIGTGITHEGTSEYSEFLYGTNPITSRSDLRLLITPKSNVINSQYDQPAQKAPITLGQVLEMLRYCYQCYWWIEEGKLKIEHIAYFKGGRQYFGTPITDIDLTGYKVVRSGKEWAFAKNKYTFEKPETAERYEFGWMDEVTAPFEGAPITVKSGYVEQGRVEEVRINNFSSDIDYILLNPSEVSSDGFVLLYAQEMFGAFELPYYLTTFEGVTVILQNGFASFAYLQRFWAYDMPAPDCESDGQEFPVRGTMRLKRQEVSFPVGDDPDLLKLIKTFLGDGQIEKLSVNLCSRMAAATLSYDTESAE